MARWNRPLPSKASKRNSTPFNLPGLAEAAPGGSCPLENSPCLKIGAETFYVALVLIAPFLAIYLLVFVYPTAQMFRISFTDAPLIGEGQWVGLDNYLRLDNDPMFRRAVWNTTYFVLMTVIPGTIIALMIALGVSRLKGRFQAIVLALSSCPTFCRSPSST